MALKSSSNIFLYALLVVTCFLLFGFVAFKASVISFTHDESYTYLHFVHENFMDIVSYKNPFTNNHILNTILMKYSEEISGSSEFTLRLPNILAFALYLVYVFRFAYKKATGLIFFFFIAMTFNPYLLDFFGLARGYGLSFAFMLMSLYHLISYFEKASGKDLVLFNAGALAASLSNFSLLNYYLTALIVFNFISYLHFRFSIKPNSQKFDFFRLNQINFLFVLISTIILYEPLRKLMKSGLLDFGGKTGFIEDTIGSMIYGLFYERPVPDTVFIGFKIFTVLVTFIVFFTVIKNIFKSREEFLRKFTHLVIANFILLSITISSILQHFLIHNDFYTGRFALFLYPLFMMNLIFYLHYLSTLAGKNFFSALSGIIAVLLIINLLYQINFTHCKDWKYDMETKKIMSVLAKGKHTGKKISLGINWLFEPTTNFYRYIWDFEELYPTNRDGIKKEYDYYYLFRSDSAAEKLRDKTVLFQSEHVNSVLLKN